MKVHNSVANVVQTVELPSAVTTYLENNKAEDEDNSSVNGGILQDTKHVWLSNGSKFTVVHIESGQKIAAWTFGAALRDFKAKVTCVCELSPPLIENTMQLLIGLECDLIGGMVCLFHCNGSKVLRAIQIDCQVICIQYIDSFPGSPLNCFDGSVLIGTHGGVTLVLDLNRQNCAETILNSTDENAVVKDELNVANLMVLSIDNLDVIVEQRAIAIRKNHHIAIQINEGCVHNVHFILRSPDDTVMLKIERENVYVTSILYVPEMNSVIIGLNIGVFQLWNLTTLQLEYTSHMNTSNLPITHIAFLEPCDDPRAFCYIWIIHSVLDRHEDGFPIAAMYSLTYQEKKSINEQHCIYRNFISCNLRFNIELSHMDGLNNFSKNFTGGRCISCQSLVKAPNKEDADEYVLNICQIVWECWTLSTISPVHSMMLLFDIDQWYKEQMPPECSTMQTNNYMSVINLSDTLTHTASSYLCDVKINADTLTSYFSVQRLEEHFFPNALGYECFCLTNNEITKILTMGVQRQLLASINKVGPSILLHPTKIFHQCVNSGLIPMYIEPYPTLEAPEHMQRLVLLSIALEARLIQFLVKCACDWATGSHTSVGCTLQLLLDWSWKRALSLKQNGDRITIPFFNHSGITPDRNTILQLDNCVRQLGHIASLYSSIIEKCSASMLPGVIEEIRERQKVIQIVAQYFQVVQWFLNVGLLPEFHVNQLSENIDGLPYPVQSLTEFYQNRRLKLHCLNGENPANENLENKSCKLLFIDEFIRIDCSEKKIKNLWNEDKSTINGLYPPPSLHSLLKIYLIPEIKEEHKHSLILYMLIDYAMIFDNERCESVIRRLMQFPTMFGLSNTAIKVTQAFWHLDHRDFQLALNQLQCVLAGGCLSQWQHDVVLSSLLVQKKTQSALQYLHVRKPYSSNESVCKLHDDWEACSNLYLSRGLVYEAFNLNKDATKYLSIDEREERLKIFFTGCKKMSLLSKVLSLPLSKHEENVFIKFLKSIDDSHANDILVMYYLNRSRYIEAQKSNDELKRLTAKIQLPYDVTNSFSMKKEHIYKTETRDQLVDLYCKTLPPITRQLANYTSSNQYLSHKATNIPVPMTVNVQAKTPKPTFYKSTLLQETIDKASETWMNKSCVKRSLKRLYQIEETPFLCTPKLTKTIQTFEEKMNITPDETPVKKAKLNTPENEQSPSTKIGNISVKLSNEINTILHTPIIERKSKWIVDNVSNHYSTEALSSRRESTPQSILKVRKLREFCNSSPVYSRYLAETDEELETNSQYTQSDNLSRSIRFKIPSRNNSPSPISEYLSDVHNSFTDLYNSEPVKNNYFNKHLSSTSVSPRKSIHHMCSDSIHVKESTFHEHDRSLSPNANFHETKHIFSTLNSSATSSKSNSKTHSPFKNTLPENIESNMSHTSSRLNTTKKHQISQLVNISNIRNSSVINKTSVLWSDTSEENISESPIASRVVNEPKFTRSESNDSMTALKSTESCKSFESSNFSQNENDAYFIDATTDNLPYTSNFTTECPKNISLCASEAPLQTVDEECIENIENNDSIDQENPCKTNLNMSEKVTSILDSFLNSSAVSGSSNRIEDQDSNNGNLQSFEGRNNCEISPLETNLVEINTSDTLIECDNRKSIEIGEMSKSTISLCQENEVSEEIKNESKAVSSSSQKKYELNLSSETNTSLLQSKTLFSLKTENINLTPDVACEKEDEHNISHHINVESVQKIDNYVEKSIHEDVEEINENMQYSLKEIDPNLNSTASDSNKILTSPVKLLKASKTASVTVSEPNSTNSSCIEISTSPVKSGTMTESLSEMNSSASSIYGSSATPTKTPKSTRTLRTPRKSIDSESVTSDQSSRRSLRSSSRRNTSMTSQSSVDSDQESNSSFSKTRRSVLASVKPNLSVIPEMSHGDDSKSWLSKSKDATQTPIDIAVYSSSRRLTRHQKSLLEKSNVSISFDQSKNTESKTNMSTIEDVDCESDSVDSNMTTETLDPILLLDKNDYKGPPDLEENAMLSEIYTFSRESSVTSNRLEIDSGSRTKETTPDSIPSKSRKSHKLLSEIQKSPARTNSPSLLPAIQDVSATDSPSSRLRRQSFNRAVEALSTPRRSRRLSTDSKKSEIESNATERESLPKNSPEKEDIKISSEIQPMNPSTSKDTEECIIAPKRQKRTKAASIHGETSVSKIDVATPSLKRKSRKSIFNTPVTKSDRLSVIEETLHKQKFKRKPGAHKIVQSLEFVKK